MANSSPLLTGLRRGLSLRCPACGQGRLFSRFLKVNPHCPACGSDNANYPADDAPPYITLMLVGHIVVPLAFVMDQGWAPPLWLMMAFWLPLTTALTLTILPFAKGAVIGIAWATGVTRDAVRQ